MTTGWKKKYHELYLQIKSELDSHVIEWVTNKEEIILASPLNYPSLKHKFSRVRRYKSGKLRILYVLSTEFPECWEENPQEPEILFLYVDLRKDETYSEALKMLRKHRIL